MEYGVGPADEGSSAQIKHTTPLLRELLDVPAIQALMDDFYDLTGMPIGLLDLDSNVLVGTGWQDACTKFHRACPESFAACLESDRARSEAVLPGEYFGYKCSNGMWDVVTPLVVGGEHLGNIFVGQFFYDDEEIDLDFFRAQAKRYGYDADAYLSAVTRVPRFSRQNIDKLMRFYAGLAGQLALIGDVNLRLRRASSELENANRQLEMRVDERTAQLEATNEELTAANEKLKSTVEALVSANDELQVATIAKDEFLAAMSHELRTPLNSIIGFSGTLLSDLTGPLDEEQQRQVMMINNSGRHLLELINGLLDFAKLESGQVPVTIEHVDPLSVVSEVLESVRPLATEKGLFVKVDSSGDIPHIRTDRTKLRQILLNLLGNAVKFTSTGGITIRVCRTHEDIRFEVEDTGQGIAPAHQGHVFDRFFQVPVQDGAKTAGTGLGLSLSLELARLLDGEILVCSEMGAGSTFTLKLPLES